MKSVSIATARNTLTELIYQAEKGVPVKLTRRGQAVAVLMAEDEYERLKNAAAAASDFAGWAQVWRSKLATGFEGITADELLRWRES